MTNKPHRELFITEFKNMSDSWVPLHAYNSKTNAELDAGLSGRVIHVIETKPVLEKIARLEKEVNICKKALRHYESVSVCLHDGDNFIADEALKELESILESK